ncbi:GntR family transcriptional regulator [Clostridium cylindrosporum]|uniref:Transcriptional regulator n=1 Tax=Clostridium cylindrosporum DSM 605 TaxID=1121307 RepID=A0A0J8D9H8_CLOCY|nr:GntR family transcriptional regulator [Clostridium cylindrosporum]KMT22695.1 transcriptional regulator [Clostridium cylindrosporum DSM 605]
MKEFSSNDDKYSLRGRVYNRVRESILDGTYKSGENLIEMRLAQELNVSRTPVREAIRQLELEGLVESIPNKGVIVKGITQKDMKDIYKIRLLLEGLAAKWSVNEISDESIKELQETFELMEFYTNKGDIENIERLNTKFHQIIYESTKSNVLLHILKDFQVYVKLARHESLAIPGRMKESLKEHSEILDAIKNRDYVQAERYLTNHVENSSKNVLK